MDKTMKINPLLPAAVLAFIIPEALAVDYLQCREMLRTRNEFIGNSVRLEHAYTKALLESIKLPADQCALERNTTQNSWDTGQNTWGNNYLKQNECEKEYKEKVKNTIKPAGTVPGGTKFYSKQAYNEYSAALKVQSDMTKAKCPYQ